MQFKIRHAPLKSCDLLFIKVILFQTSVNNIKSLAAKVKTSLQIKSLSALDERQHVSLLRIYDKTAALELIS